jgi:hypothetical protein
MKYAELFYRLRALERAELETARAVELAGNGWELSLARRQLQDIRQKRRDGTQRPEWNKPLKSPVYFLLALIVVLSVVMVIQR